MGAQFQLVELKIVLKVSKYPNSQEIDSVGAIKPMHTNMLFWVERRRDWVAIHVLLDRAITDVKVCLRRLNTDGLKEEYYCLPITKKQLHRTIRYSHIFYMCLAYRFSMASNL